ncbi:hypothetical protein F4859DRAFT_333179 [Xylaria cf. heliscus]|nr:hypothetical protein F4859DRAFT_333179 [Xylaria cf. heliscus]
MSGAELPLAIIGTADIAFKYGKKLLELCAAFREAEKELKERALRIEACWLKISKQLEFTQQVEGMMDTHHRNIHSMTIDILQSKLKIVTSKLESVVRMPDEDSDINSTNPGGNVAVTPRRWKYALLKESIDKAIEELEMWQLTADPSWYLILKSASSQIDQALASSNKDMITSFPAAKTIRAGLREVTSDEPAGVFLPSSELEKMAITDIPFCDAQAATRISTRKGIQHFLLAQVVCPPEVKKAYTIRRNLRDLARKLSHDSPRNFSLLSCKGVIERVDATNPDMPSRVTFTMVFRTPPQFSNPRSLREHLVSGIERISLSDKFDVARQMATSISYVHTFGFVHKDIRPETMITFSEPQSPSSPAAFLIGFGSVRKEEGVTYRIGDDSWWKNLYRHPSRQGSRPNEEYIMQHDIYSLGVCLLETGLGKSFVSYNGENNQPSLSPDLGFQSDNTSLLGSDTLKDHLVGLARDELPTYMGRRYAAVVKTCLTCLDHDNTDFGDEKEFLDSDGVLVGVRYIEKVLSQLNAICV